MPLQFKSPYNDMVLDRVSVSLYMEGYRYSYPRYLGSYTNIDTIFYIEKNQEWKERGLSPACNPMNVFNTLT